MHCRCVLLVLVSSVAAWGAQPRPCEPAPEIRAELQKAAAVVVTDPADFDRNIAPFLALRERHPGDLFVHERYQDAVQQYGIEGHLKALTEEYRTLSIERPGELMYRYLYVRTLVGRSTLSALAVLSEIVTDNPDFAPGHRALAEIYASEAFRDARKENVERERFLAVCPGSVVGQRPSSLPDPSPLVERAERLLAENGDPDRIVKIAVDGVRADEWRLQRIRPFDWYSVDYKLQNQRDLQAEYWRVWSIQVRCFRKAGQPGKATALLAEMDQRAAILRNHSDPSYWDALALLAQLYAEGHQKDQATAKLDEMRHLLGEHPDPGRTSRLDDLSKSITGRD